MFEKKFPAEFSSHLPSETAKHPLFSLEDVIVNYVKI